MKKYVVEIAEKVTYNVEVDAVSSESAENIAREMYDSGIFEGEGELERVSFDVESYDCITELVNTSHDGIDNAAHCPINDKDLCLDELVRDLFNDGQYAWNKDNTEMVGFVGNEPILVRQETDNKLLVRFLGDAWCPDIVEEWVKRIEHDKNNDVDYVIDAYMFGVIENDRERRSSDFHVSFCYRG